MAHHSLCDILSEPVKIGPVTAMNRFFRSHIATECEEACLINLSYFFDQKGLRARMWCGQCSPVFKTVTSFDQIST